MTNKKGGIVVGITGASGAILGHRILLRIKELIDESQKLRVVMSDTARKVWKHELMLPLPEETGFTVYDNHHLFADIASGSASYHTMIVCPCSMGTVGRIAAGVSDTLLTRAADVMLKEQRKLVLVIREAPLSLIHLRNLTTLTESGALVFPATPFFYHHPRDLDELINPLVNRVLETAGMPGGGYHWGE